MAPAHAEAAAPWKVRQTAKSLAVAGGATGSLTIRCRRGYTAIAGAFVSYSPGIATLRSVPVGRRAWLFGVANSAAGAGQFQASVNCARLRPPRGFTTELGFSDRKGTVDLAGRANASFALNCRRGYAPIGFGGERPGLAGAPARASDLGAIGQVDVGAAVPSPGRWNFTLRNLGSTPARARMVARCLKRSSTARSKRAVASKRKRRKKRKHSNVVRRVSRQLMVRPGNNDGLELPCPEDHVGARTGHAFPPMENTFLYTSWADPRRGGTWNIFSAEDVTVALVLLCLDQRQAWRREE